MATAAPAPGIPTPSRVLGEAVARIGAFWQLSNARLGAIVAGDAPCRSGRGTDRSHRQRSRAHRHQRLCRHAARTGPRAAPADADPWPLDRSVAPWRGRVIRIVEAQHRIATNRLAADAGDEALADAARAAGLAAIRAPSARHAGGVNVAGLDPAALVPPPRPHSSRAFLATADGGAWGLIATREMSADALRFTAAGMGIGQAVPDPGS